MAWWYASRKEEEEAHAPPESDPLALWEATPSQRATIKYFWVVSALILVQMLLGVVTAHYGVEGDGFYGIPALRVAAVQRDPHLARPDGPVLDRHGVAGGRAVHRPAGQRPRAEVPAAGRQRAVRRAAAGGGRLADRRVAEHSEQDDRPGVVLPRAPGLRVRRPGPRLADRPVRRPVALALPDDPRAAAGACGSTGEQKQLVAAAGGGDRGDRPVLRGGAHVGPAHAPVDGRVLAVVGGPPVGRGVLRGVRHDGHRVLSSCG